MPAKLYVIRGEDGWSIYHLPTGVRVATRATRADALAVRRALEEGALLHYTLPKPSEAGVAALDATDVAHGCDYLRILTEE